MSNKYTSRRAFIERACTLPHQTCHFLLDSFTARIDIENLINIIQRLGTRRVVVKCCFEIHENVIRQALDENCTHILITDGLTIE